LPSIDGPRDAPLAIAKTSEKHIQSAMGLAIHRSDSERRCSADMPSKLRSKWGLSTFPEMRASVMSAMSGIFKTLLKWLLSVFKAVKFVFRLKYHMTTASQRESGGGRDTYLTH
jgi:hypothetical protein